MLFVAASQAAAQVQSGGKGNSKKDEKQLKKEAKKLEKTAEEAAQGLGRDSVFCILAAHTSVSGFETGPQLKAKFESLTDFPFGQFVAAVLLVDRLDKEGFGLNEVLAKLEAGMSIGEITKEAGVNMGDVRKGFGEMRSELARSMNNPPTRNCFETTP
jgi:HAMP domain-containing protein